MQRGNFTSAFTGIRYLLKLLKGVSVTILLCGPRITSERCKVVTVVESLRKMAVVWDVMPCSLVEIY